ncbi:MAG: ABC transporter permease [Anaerovoracaceae bacterium]
MLKVTKKATPQKRQEIKIQIIAILLAFVFAGIVILIMGFNPIEVYMKIVNGAIGTESRIQQTVIISIPLIITSMGILVAFKMKFWNIGGEGQIMMGALGGTLVALNAPESTPGIILIPIMMVAGMVFGGLWAFIPAFFKAKFGTNETVFTLMMNYIAIKFITYLQFGPMKDPNAGGYGKIANFSDNAVMGKLFGVHFGWVIAIVAVIAVYVFVNHTKKGYEITVVGESLETARYAGMNINGIIITAMLVSGGLCGMAGVIQASAVERTLTSTISAGYGFTAIITSWLGKLSAPIVALVCVLFAMLLQGGAYIQIAMSVPAAVAGMIQGIILFFVLGSEFFLQYNVSFEKKHKEAC